MKNCEKKGSSSAICIQGTRGVGGGRQKTIRDAPCQCMETGTLGRRNWTTPSLQEHLQPQGSRVPRLSTMHPQAPDPQISPGIGGNGAFLERDKPLPVQELLGQARKSSPKRGSEMGHPQNPPKSRVCAHLGEGVNTSGNGLRDLIFSGHCQRPQAENLWSKPFQGAANTFSKDKRQKNLG